jgi:hypothetical protein
MKTGLLFVLVAALVVPGCSRYRTRVNQELLERELRLQEDCIWKLRWQIEDQQRALDEARAKAETYKKEADTVRGKAANGPDLTPPSTIIGPADGGRDTEAPRLPPAPPAGAPLIERGTEIAPPVISPKPGGAGGSGRSTPSRSSPEIRGPELTQASATSSATRARKLDDAAKSTERLNPDLTIDRIVLNETLSGGLNLDGKPGDEWQNHCAWRRVDCRSRSGARRQSRQDCPLGFRF